VAVAGKPGALLESISVFMLFVVLLFTFYSTQREKIMAVVRI
jgi:hypothetical protein